MQFTNRKGKGTYALVVRRCPAASLDPNFERGATNLLNAMKAAICLLDLELAAMRATFAAHISPTRLCWASFRSPRTTADPATSRSSISVLTRMKVDLDELSRPGVQPEGSSVTCPCVWKADGEGVRPMAIRSTTTRTGGTSRSYQSIVSLFE
jgi:hypothetical protein